MPCQQRCFDLLKLKNVKISLKCFIQALLIQFFLILKLWWNFLQRETRGQDIKNETPNAPSSLSLSFQTFSYVLVILVIYFKVIEFQKSHRQRLATNKDKKVLSTDVERCRCLSLKEEGRAFDFPFFPGLAFCSVKKEKGRGT